MLTFALCDDEAYFLEKLQASVRRYLSAHGLEARILRFSSGEALLNTGEAYDILFMDLKLPGKSGIEVVKELRNNGNHTQVIFITSYQQYAFQAFHLDAIHYLLKPVSDVELFHALDKAFMWMAQKDGKALMISKGGSTQRIFIRDILYCEAIDHKIYIHTSAMNYDYFGTLETLAAQLDERFFRCHRSYIVNLHFVVSKERDTATVLGGDIILVSRRKQLELTHRLLDIFRKEAL